MQFSIRALKTLGLSILTATLIITPIGNCGTALAGNSFLGNGDLNAARDAAEGAVAEQLNEELTEGLSFRVVLDRIKIGHHSEEDLRYLDGLSKKHDIPMNTIVKVRSLKRISHGVEIKTLSGRWVSIVGSRESGVIFVNGQPVDIKSKSAKQTNSRIVEILRKTNVSRHHLLRDFALPNAEAQVVESLFAITAGLILIAGVIFMVGTIGYSLYKMIDIAVRGISFAEFLDSLTDSCWEGQRKQIPFESSSTYSVLKKLSQASAVDLDAAQSAKDCKAYVQGLNNSDYYAHRGNVEKACASAEKFAACVDSYKKTSSSPGPIPMNNPPKKQNADATP